MARRPKVNGDTEAQVAGLKAHLDKIVGRGTADDLRSQVLALIPVYQKLQDLGVGLMQSPGSSARDRIIQYLCRYHHTLIDGNELMVVAGIGEWARRVRELRVEYGWSIYSGVTVKELAQDSIPEMRGLREALGIDPLQILPNQYVLMRQEADREAAYRWNQNNLIRKKKGSAKDKILELLRLNVGHAVTSEELRYVSGEKSEWARRIRELRTEDGWPIVGKMQGREDLPNGSYLLEADKQSEPHDRRISDETRISVLTRDNFSCTVCHWKRTNINREDPRKRLELHHIINHKDKGVNTIDNLTTLCNVHHDEVHAGRLNWNTIKWINTD